MQYRFLSLLLGFSGGFLVVGLIAGFLGLGVCVGLVCFCGLV